MSELELLRDFYAKWEYVHRILNSKVYDKENHQEAVVALLVARDEIKKFNEVTH